jgi:hypothetical protein
MNEAMKPENKKDQAMLMAMAMQMCAQADQNMAAAMKNDEGQKKISANDIPKMAEMKIGNVQLGKDKVKEAEIPRVTFNDEESKGSSSDSEIPMPTPLSIPDLNSQVFNKPSTTDDLKDPITNFTKDPTTSTLDPIDRSAKAEEPPSKGVGPTAAFSGGTGATGAGMPGRGAGSDKGSDTPTISDAENTASSRKRGGVLTAGTGDAGGGSEKSGSSFDLSSLMAQMMGEPPPGEGGSGLDVIQLNSQAPEEKPPNLFEYASFRYHKLATEKGAVRRR